MRIRYFSSTDTLLIEFRDALPKNPQDKVLKYQLRQEGVTAVTWDLETSGIRLEKR